MDPVSVGPEIKATRLDIFMERAYCPNDGTELKRGPFVLTSNPVQYDHTCPRCGFQMRGVIDYPRHVYVEAEV